MPPPQQWRSCRRGCAHTKSAEFQHASWASLRVFDVFPRLAPAKWQGPDTQAASQAGGKLSDIGFVDLGKYEPACEFPEPKVPNHSAVPSLATIFMLALIIRGSRDQADVRRVRLTTVRARRSGLNSANGMHMGLKAMAASGPARPAACLLRFQQAGMQMQSGALVIC